MQRKPMTVKQIRNHGEMAFAPERGLYVPTDALDRYARAQYDEGITNIFFIGDSIVAGAGTFGESHAPRVGRILGRRHTFGGIGYRNVNHVSWTESGTWTTASTTNLADNDLWGATRFGNGATAIQTYTINPLITETPVENFDIHFTDGTFVTGAPSYRIDGGSWTDFPSGTFNQTNTYQAINIDTAVTDTLDIRAANAAGTARPIYVHGASFNTDATDAVRVHQIGSSGNLLAQIVRSTVGNQYSIFDEVTPHLAVLGPFSNDAILYNDSAAAEKAGAESYYQSYLELIDAVQAAGGDCILTVTTNPDTNTAQMRSRESIYRAAQERNCAVFDVWEAWGSNSAEALESGLLFDTIHPAQKGHDDMATRYLRLLDV